MKKLCENCWEIIDYTIKHFYQGNIVQILYPTCKKHNLNPFKEATLINIVAETSPGMGSEKWDYAYNLWLENLGEK